MTKILSEYDYVYFRHSDKAEKQKKWQRIALSKIEAYRDKSKNLDVFCTAQRFCTAEKDAEEGEKEIHLCDVYFDFDSKDLVQAQADVKKLIDYFCKGHDVPATNVRVHYSGKKGFHVFVDYRVFDIQPDEELTYIIKDFALSLKKDLGLTTLDEGVYTLPRMIRLPNSIHSATKLYKTELSHTEVNLSVEEIKELAKVTREPLFDASEYEYVDCVQSLADLYKKFYARYQLNKQLTINKEPVILQQTELASCVKDLLKNHIKESGTRNNATIFLACYFKDSGFSEQATIDTLIPWALRTPKDFTSTHNEVDLKNSTSSCIKSVYASNEYHFYCNAMRKLNVSCDYNKCAALKDKANFNAVLQSFTDNYIIEDTDPIRVVFATVIANLFEADPLWLFLIAPPSYLKTECITSLNDTPFTYALSSLTAQTFASGMKNAPNASLLKKLKKKGIKILALKDFTSILSIRQESRAEILAQLREIYDGAYSKSFGTGEEINWTGKLGIIAGVTTIIDTHYSIYQTMGERFIQYRIESADEMTIATKSIANIGKDSNIRSIIRKITASYLEDLQIPPISKIKKSETLIKKISELACFIVKARSGVIRDPYRHNIEYIPDAEGPARLAKQLAVLGCALAVLDGRDEINEADYLLLCKVAWHCLPKQRASVLKALSKTQQSMKTADVGKAINYPTTTVRMFLEDLHGVNILDKDIEELKAKEEGAKDKLIYSWRIKLEYVQIIARLVEATQKAIKEENKAVEKAGEVDNKIGAEASKVYAESAEELENEFKELFSDL